MAKLKEFEIQALIFEWAKNDKRLYRMIMLSANVTSIGAALRNKKLGYKKGVPDIFLPLPKGKYYGLFIEIKKDDNSKNKRSYHTRRQRNWCLYLNRLNYLAVMTVGLEETKKVISEYLELKDNEELKYFSENRKELF